MDGARGVQNKGLRQPFVDNDREGFPVFATDADGNPTDEIIRFSRDCSAEILVQNSYKSTSGAFKPCTLHGDRPEDRVQEESPFFPPGVIDLTDWDPWRSRNQVYSVDQTPEALEVMDEWMINIQNSSDTGVAANKPARAVDRCVNADGTEIAAGERVSDGILDDTPRVTVPPNFRFQIKAERRDAY